MKLPRRHRGACFWTRISHGCECFLRPGSSAMEFCELRGLWHGDGRVQLVPKGCKYLASPSTAKRFVDTPVHLDGPIGAQQAIAEEDAHFGDFLVGSHYHRHDEVALGIRVHLCKGDLPKPTVHQSKT